MSTVYMLRITKGAKATHSDTHEFVGIAKRRMVMPTFLRTLDRKTIWLNQKQISDLVFRLIFHNFFYCLTVVLVSFCSLMKGITPKICRLCFFLINSVILNLLCAWARSLCQKCRWQATAKLVYTLQLILWLRIKKHWKHGA